MVNVGEKKFKSTAEEVEYGRAAAAERRRETAERRVANIRRVRDLADLAILW